MVIAADGATSRVRALAEFRHRKQKVSTITGFVIDCGMLPAPGYGHIFLGGPAPVLVYEIGQGKCRVLFDQPVKQEDEAPAQHHARMIESLPEILRSAIAAALATQRGQRLASLEVCVEQASYGPVALVGDAGGTCHPLTATGITGCVRDALLLRNAFKDGRGNVAAALTRYRRGRRSPQRARHLVGSTLHQSCSSSDPALMLIRAGLIRYWQHDESNCAASMAILGLNDTRLTSVLREMLKVIGYGIMSRARLHGRNVLSWSFINYRLIAEVSALLIRQMTMAMRFR